MARTRAMATKPDQEPLVGETALPGATLPDVRRGIGMFRSVDVPILGIIENMSYFSCSNCRKIDDIFGRGGGQQLTDDYHLPLLGKIRIDPLFREGGDTGKPVVDNPAWAVG